MTKYRAIKEENKDGDVEAVRWFKMGDHPKVEKIWRSYVILAFSFVILDVKPGDWVVKYDDGKYWVADDKVFKENYEVKIYDQI